MEWDVGDDTSFVTTFPYARNRVHWENLYSFWKDQGFAIDASIQFDSIPIANWKNLAKDAERYGTAFAKSFDPSATNLIECAEIGNEPGKYDDAQYRELFTAMARGLRAGEIRMHNMATTSDTPVISNVQANNSHARIMLTESPVYLILE